MAGLSQNPIRVFVVQPILGSGSMLTLRLFFLAFFSGLFQEFELKLFISAVLEGHFRIASVPDAYPTCLLDCDKCNQSFMLNICL